MRKTTGPTSSGSKQARELRSESDFSLKEWALKAKLTHQNRGSGRFSETNLKSFRENASTFRSDFTVSSTASSPGCTLNGEIDPSTYSFTTALKALQGRMVYTWEYMSEMALSSKWNDAERYIWNPLSGQFPLECLSAKTLSGRSFLGKTSRITISAPLVYSSSSTSLVPHANSRFPKHEGEIEITSRVKRSNKTRDVGIQSTPGDDSRSPAQTPSNGERSMELSSSPLCSQKLKPETEKILMGSVQDMLDEQLLILFASQTGNAMDAAERLGREAERRGCPSVSVLSIDEFQPSNLPNKEAVVFVVSTTGQGENPDSMKGFWRLLLQKNLTREWLKGVHYAVFGLGDSSYQKYNFVAKKLDKRLSDLGAEAIIERGLGDDQHPSGYEGALDPWMFALWNMLYQKNPKLLPNGPNSLTRDATLLDQPRMRIIYHAEEWMPPLSTTEDEKELEMKMESVCSMTRGKFSGKNRPHCFVKMTKNLQLSRADSGKDVRHLEFEAVSSSINYEVGDVLEILPGQSPTAVDAFIQRCNLNPELYITVQHRDKASYGFLDRSMFPVKLKSFVESTMDVASASPRRYFFEIMSHFATAEHEKERLQYFASPEGGDDLYQYNQKERRTVLEVLEDFPSVQMPFEWLVQLVPPLKTRAFSISSSLSAHPNQVHLTVNVVSWTTPYKRKREGLCSSWLASLDPEQSHIIPVWFSKGSLPSPPPSLPLILVGPGTGCAPFHGFVEERAAQSKTISTAPILFFFGCRSQNDDFLYRDFWYSHSENNGVLSEEKGGGFYVAFSRDQPQQKVYVQHKMREKSKKVWSLLTAGATIYVAGSANKMPSDVLSAFVEIVSTEGGVSKEEALRWIRALEKGGKYHVEAWSS